MFLILLSCCGLIYCQGLFSPYSDTLEANSADIKTADSLFNLANSKLNFLEYNDCNNCTLRAHVLTFLFSKLYPDLKIAKAWIFADSKLESRKDYYKTHIKGYLSYKNMCPLWGFHVAPAIIFETDTLVIDPSTQNSPAKLSDWVKNLSSAASAYIILKENKYYSYPEKGDDDLFNDNTADWEENKFGSTEDEINFMARKLTTAYHSFFDPIRFNYYKKRLYTLANLH